MGKVFKQPNCKQAKQKKPGKNSNKTKTQKKKKKEARLIGISLIEVLHFMTFLKNLLILKKMLSCNNKFNLRAAAATIGNCSDLSGAGRT